MIQDPSDPSARLSRGFLLATFAILLAPAFVLLLTPGTEPAAALGWFVGLVPLFLWTYAFRWRGTMTALVAILGAMAVVEAGIAARGLAPTPLVVPVAFALGFAGLAVALLMVRVERDQGSLEEVALTDRLTSLPNRRHARVFLETMFGAAERGRPVSVVLFDLDDFRSYNDRMGSREGDEALRAFASLLAASTRRMNLSARFGGEEFISILAGADEDGARAFADRVRETFRLSRPASRQLTLSAGVASFHPSMRRPDELVGAADLALYRAKEEGGDRVRVFGRDVRTRDAMEGGEEGEAAPLSRSTDFARPAEEVGKSPPPLSLLPPADPRFGTGRRVLLASDQEDLLESLPSYLAREGFEVEVVAGIGSVLLALGAEADVVLLDERTLGGDTPDAARATRSRWPSTQILLLREAPGPGGGGESLLAFVHDLLPLPLELRAVQAALVDALGRRDRHLEEARDRSSHPTFSDDTADAGDRLRLRGLLALVRAGELRDPCTRGHALRVARYAALLYDALDEEGRSGFDREELVQACLLHDIGKLEIPEAILVKEAPLTAAEFGLVRRHPAAGREILEPVLPDPVVLAVTGWHHERWDGGGYPDGLAGPSIPLAARIAAIADALDAMTSPRAYRDGLAWDDAVRQIRERFGSHYDPGLADAFRKTLPELHRVHGEAWGPGKGGAPRT